MKSKKGFIPLAILPIIYGVMAIVFIGLLIWFGFRINEGLQAVFGFLKEWWLYFAIGIFALIWNKQLQAIVNAILRRIGIKV